MTENGVARYAALRGTWKHMANSFKGEVAGSDKRFSFSVPAKEKSDKLIVTESAIDALSVATLRGDIGDLHYLSVGGVYIFNGNHKTEFPMSLEMYLNNHKEIKKIELCLDNDRIGEGANYSIMKNLIEIGYEVLSIQPEKFKDYNEYLMRI